jgi:nitroimidazol reductase NimA-like FMN-containing flavoprotein (pyridoxamine 5'-phosphate oxidase superfamily)
MSDETLKEMIEVKMTRKLLVEMSQNEIEQFLTCAPVGRVGINLQDSPYIVPIGFGYENGEIFFHTCYKGLKMEGMRQNPNVCFEVDESTSDASMFKSVIVNGPVSIIDDRAKMRPYLQKLINKYRVPVIFDEYMRNRDTEKEMSIVRVCVIKIEKMSGRMMVRINREKLSL